MQTESLQQLLASGQVGLRRENSHAALSIGGERPAAHHLGEGVGGHVSGGGYGRADNVRARLSGAAVAFQDKAPQQPVLMVKLTPRHWQALPPWGLWEPWR